MLACRRGHLEVVEMLLEEGADPAVCAPKTQRTALHAAAMGGSARCTAALFTQCRGDAAWRLVDAPTSNGVAPIHYAALYGFAPVVRVLLAAGARAALPALGGEGGGGELRGIVPQSTPLHLAAMRGHSHVALALLEFYVNQMLHQMSAMDAAAATPAGERLPWEGDRSLDPRLAVDARWRTPFDVSGRALLPFAL
ncbi:MAG: ankyrin repeat-containing domain protein [Monoraphidium minutum]|nr:MAG: ankyrin repeat-containing domain protein [Monoraphidium minutum]